jgi:hypothetical protein
MNFEPHAVQREAQDSRRRAALPRVAVITVCLLYGLPAGAASSSCPRELGSADITLIKSVLHLRGVAHAREDQQCAAYRQHVATVSKVRELFERCLLGAKREGDLQQLEGALEDANGVIAHVCDQ